MLQTLNRAHPSFYPHPASLAPDVVLDRLSINGHSVFVARDDLLPGGSKQRACEPLLKSLALQGYNEFIYASPFCGFAQIALAYVCQRLNLKCQIFCETAPGLPYPSKHEFARIAESFGAQVVIVPTLQDAEESAEFESHRSPNAHKIPLGFNCREFKDAFEVALRKQWQIITQKLGHAPKRLWLPVGSGTLASVFSRIIDASTEVKCVNVNILGLDDPRIQAISSNSQYTLFAAKERFHEPAFVKAGIPSNIHYDAKLWQFLLEQGQDGDLWWNVAR